MTVIPSSDSTPSSSIAFKMPSAKAADSASPKVASAVTTMLPAATVTLTSFMLPPYCSAIQTRNAVLSKLFGSRSKVMPNVTRYPVASPGACGGGGGGVDGGWLGDGGGFGGGLGSMHGGGIEGGGDMGGGGVGGCGGAKHVYDVLSSLHLELLVLK